jgi:peptidoglycan lytic transglycosylase
MTCAPVLASPTKSAAWGIKSVMKVRVFGFAALLVAIVMTVAGCAARARPPATKVLDVREGLASYYGPGFDGKTTASGVRFDMHAMVAAHRTYPFGTIVRVTNLVNARTVQVRVVDRGPFVRTVLIDLSYGAAEALGFVRDGRTRVRLEVVRWGNPR